MPSVSEMQQTFFKLLLGRNEGFLCLAFATPDRSSFKELFYRYPEQLPEIIHAIEHEAPGTNAYFCPHLFSAKRRTKDNVSVAPNAWADLDTCKPENLLVAPSIAIQSSPGRYQAYWLLEGDGSPEASEDLSRRIAYYHHEEGADRSGWDLTQLLRIPFTANLKHEPTSQVKILAASKTRYHIEDFAQYPAPPGYVMAEEPMPEDLPDESPEDILAFYRSQLNPMVHRLYEVEPEGDWSKALWNLEMALFESGLTKEQVFIVATEAACNKYRRDNKPPILLWKEVVKAHARYESNLRPPSQEAIDARNPAAIPLLTEEERMRSQEDITFVERYIEWAKSLGDAAPQYHQAGAFIALSAVLSGSVRLPTSYGVIQPNLWFMILADTTLTRKTTAMDIAMDLIAEIDSDAVLATDGSIEGLMTGLQTRPRRPSVFLRDEFTGLLEMIVKRDYYAGMPELFTKLYDGKMQKRLLRKETVEIKDPCLIIFAGGIKSRMSQLLKVEHVSSGFMPRFVFITAESDVSRLRPLGPPVARAEGNRGAIRSELEDMLDHYTKPIPVAVLDGRVKTEKQPEFIAQLTEAAWVRYNKIEAALLEGGLASSRPELMTPTFDRLSKSMLKAAVLIAASRKLAEGDIEVTEADIIKAAYYGEGWRTHVVDVMDGVGKGQSERQLELLMGAIRKRGETGVQRSFLMQAYHLNAREIEDALTTLEQRNVITRSRIPGTKGERITANV
jgi:hypothetical protein